MNDEEVKAYREYLMKEMAESFSSLSMAYDCECGARTYFILDRFPMSYKIGFQCESCKKFDFRKIVEPFVYYSKLFGEIKSGEDIIFTAEDDPQNILLKQHIEFEKNVSDTRKKN